MNNLFLILFWSSRKLLVVPKENRFAESVDQFNPAQLLFDGLSKSKQMVVSWPAAVASLSVVVAQANWF